MFRKLLENFISLITFIFKKICSAFNMNQMRAPGAWNKEKLCVFDTERMHWANF